VRDHLLDAVCQRYDDAHIPCLSPPAIDRVSFGSMTLRMLIFGIWWLVSQAALAAPSRYQCSYYLFEVPAAVTGCSDCYVPLVVAQWPMEAGRDQEVVVITTYERDSIWQVRRQLLKHSETEIDPQSRRIRWEALPIDISW
jgi:hypothetical protein